jgi:peptide/nickel transport system permease protein
MCTTNMGGDPNVLRGGNQHAFSGKICFKVKQAMLDLDEGKDKAQVLGVGGTAGMIRVMRGNLLDELRVNYVQAVRAKGVPESTVILKHAVRNAFHPLLMALGGVLAWLISGTSIVEQVLGLPTLGPLFIQATLEQDIYLSGTILILISFLLVLGNLLADIALAWLDPRIRFD